LRFGCNIHADSLSYVAGWSVHRISDTLLYFGRSGGHI